MERFTMNLRLHLFIYASLDNKNDRIEDKKYRLINRVFSSLVPKKQEWRKVSLITSAKH